MNKKIIILTSLIFIVIITFGFVFYFNIHYSPIQVELEKCNTLKYNGEGINMVFFSDKKNSEKYMKYFLNTKPFKNLEEDFNFYYINYKPECEIYKGAAILCYNKKLIKKASSCPNDFIIVINNNENRQIRSSSYTNVMSLNAKHPLSVFIHEFGHSIATLAEEYVPAKIPRGSQNCQKECSGFKGEKDGCFNGCSDTNHIRSIENGVMRTLRSNEYGKFNEKVIKEKINKKKTSITGNVIMNSKDCSKEKYYLIEGVYSNKTIKINNKTIEKGCVGTNGAGPFSYEMVLKNGEILDKGKFNPELIFSIAPNDTTNEVNGKIYENTGKFYLKIPAIKSEELRINDKDKGLIKKIELYDMGGRACLV